MGNWFSDLISAPTKALGLGSITDIFNNMTGQTALNMSNEQFNRSLDWEKEKFNKNIELANTAHQREIEDLKKSGLNPVLSAGSGNGASSNIGGAGVAPTAHLDFSGLTSMITSVLPGLAQMKQANSAQKLADSESLLQLGQFIKTMDESDLLKIEKWFKTFDQEHYLESFQNAQTKSPRGMARWLGEIFQKGSDFGTANGVGKVGEQIYSLETAGEKSGLNKVIDSLSIPGKLKKDFKLFMFLIRGLMAEDFETLGDIK